MTNSVIQYLETHGPSPVSELPRQVSTREKMNGAATLTVNTRSRGEHSTGKTSTTIAYLFEDHDRVDVAKAWFAANSDYFPADDLHSVQNAIGSSLGKKWTKAFGEAAREYGYEPRQNVGGSEEDDMSYYNVAVGEGDDA